MRTIIDTPHAPAPIGCYSQAVRVGNTVYLSGQVGIDPATQQLVSDDFDKQLSQVFQNMQAVIAAAGGSFDRVAKLTIFLIDLSDFPAVNEIMGNYFTSPYPARSTVEVSRLPKNARVEIEAVLDLS